MIKKIINCLIIQKKKGSKTEKVGLHLYTKHHEAVTLLKFSIIDH
jgi:hypothetical protein